MYLYLTEGLRLPPYCHIYVRTGCGIHSECLFMNISGIFILLFTVCCFLIPQTLDTVRTLYPYYLLFLRSCCLHISTSGIKRDAALYLHMRSALSIQISPCILFSSTSPLCLLCLLLSKANYTGPPTSLKIPSIVINNSVSHCCCLFSKIFCSPITVTHPPLKQMIRLFNAPMAVCTMNFLLHLLCLVPRYSVPLL